MKPDDVLRDILVHRNAKVHYYLRKKAMDGEIATIAMCHWVAKLNTDAENDIINACKQCQQRREKRWWRRLIK